MGAPDLETRLGVRFRDGQLLKTALTHPSAADPRRRDASWQRLEFLGDSVITFSLSDMLFRLHPDSPEGLLATLRARLISGPSLCARVSELGLEDFLEVHESHRPLPPGILEDAFEVLMGAVYLDRGFETARALVERLFREAARALSQSAEAPAAKSRLQEYFFARGMAAPEYRHEDTQGPDHQQVHSASVFGGGRLLGSGQGSSKRAAETAAAEAALQGLSAPPSPPHLTSSKDPALSQETP